MNQKISALSRIWLNVRDLLNLHKVLCAPLELCQTDEERQK
jgi:hypothetical protein